MENPVKTYNVEEARQKLERYCAYQDRCHKEVREKLREMRMIPQAADQIMLHLLQEKFLDEERFACSFARGKFKTKKWGKSRIVRELKAREISQPILKIALKEINDGDYLDTFEELTQKRMNQLTTEKDKYKKRKKFADYLLYRGWPGDWVYNKAKELIL